MSDSRAYTYYINPYGSGPDEQNLVNVTSPSWVLTFVRWKYRDTLRIQDVDAIYKNANQNPSALNALKLTEEPLIVVNDCMAVTVTSSKSSFTPNMEATLLFTDVNYLTAVAPGDFVFVNMVNWTSSSQGIANGQVTADDIYNRVRNGNNAINGFNDGFKGLFKVQSVTKTVAIINEQTGAKGVVFKITGFAFTEFNNLIYFDPSVTLQAGGSLVFASRISETWLNLIKANKTMDIQDLIKNLIISFIGNASISDANKITGNSIGISINQTPNSKFYMPSIIGSLLGIKDPVQSAKDIYNYLFGIQNYANTSSNTSPKLGFNPPIGSQDGRFYYTNKEIAGKALLAPEYWNQVKTWDILNQYVNSPLNEFFTTFRVDPQNGRVMPTVVLRQIPFTSEDFFNINTTVPNTTPVTKFLNIPRWKVHPSLIFSQEVGRSEALRINYVQVFGRILQNNSLGADYTLETASGNYVFDLNDIQRSGLRTAVISNMFDIYSSGGNNEKFSINSPTWAHIYGDAVIGQHLRLTGTFTCIGIPQPIAVGDNFEFEDVVYHIEQVTHRCVINPANGVKSFRTIVSVSNGMSIYSSVQNGTVYPEMSNTNGYADRKSDYSKPQGQILPGISESQATPARQVNIDNSSSTPNPSFPQPKKIGVYPDPPKNSNNNGQT